MTNTEIQMLKNDLDRERTLRAKFESMLALNAQIEAQFVDGSPEKMVAEIARLTHLINNGREAMEIASRFIGKPSPKAPCHIGFCEMEQCGRCGRAKLFYNIFEKFKK